MGGRIKAISVHLVELYNVVALDFSGVEWSSRYGGKCPSPKILWWGSNRLGHGMVTLVGLHTLGHGVTLHLSSIGAREGLHVIGLCVDSTTL